MEYRQYYENQCQFGLISQRDRHHESDNGTNRALIIVVNDQRLVADETWKSTRAARHRVYLPSVGGGSEEKKDSCAAKIRGKRDCGCCLEA